MRSGMFLRMPRGTCATASMLRGEGSTNFHAERNRTMVALAKSAVQTHGDFQPKLNYA